ncbi:hypothetical protein ACXM0N_08480 [Peribacillus simplex]
MDNINDKRVIHFLSNEVKCFKREELVKKVLELSCEGIRLSYGGKAVSLESWIIYYACIQAMLVIMSVEMDFRIMAWPFLT